MKFYISAQAGTQTHAWDWGYYPGPLTSCFPVPVLHTCSCHSGFENLSPCHKGPCQSQDWDPNFTCSERMTESCHLCWELTVLSTIYRALCVAVLCLHERTKQSLLCIGWILVREERDYFTAGGQTLIHLPGALVKLETSWCSTKIASLQDEGVGGVWNIRIHPVKSLYMCSS